MVCKASLVDVLQVEMSRWMTPALFGPVGNQTNNPIMLPAQIWWAVRQRLSAIETPTDTVFSGRLVQTHMCAVSHKDTVDSLKTLIKTLKINYPSGHFHDYRTLTFVDNSQREIFYL